MPKTPDYLIGIDLGTTNTVVAYADLSKPLEATNCSIFEIEQLVAPGEVAARSQLPSFRYHPAEGEINPQDCLLPWSAGGSPLEGDIAQVIIGEWARELGSKTEGRQVHSAKSWLSHDKVDREADILPWAAQTDTQKVSPVTASASYLAYIKEAWNHQNPDALLEEQEIVITIPASFDEMARKLTIQAANLAGYPLIHLLEEPQAVCYQWYITHLDNINEHLNTFNRLLVCDIGGGTTDLSLLTVDTNEDDSLSLKRIGVGEHLMLGGDNIDHALSHIAERKIHGDDAKKKLSAASLSQLAQQTRQVKELLLSDPSPESAKVVLLGSGSRLIGGAKSCELSKQQVEAIALDGFIPQCGIDATPEKSSVGLVSLGLPYAKDPAISKHVAQFLSQFSHSQESVTGHDSADAVLFNGGVFKSDKLKNRMIDILAQWNQGEIQCLDNKEPDLAVAKGAVSYGMARKGAFQKIGGGSPRSYFLVVDRSEDMLNAICILPKGTEEEQNIALEDRKFLLTVGQPVRFHLIATTADVRYQAGELLALHTESLVDNHWHELPALIVNLEQSDASSNDSIEVTLSNRMTEFGTLEIECIASSDTQRKWLVEFELRKTTTQKSATASVVEALHPKIDEVLSLLEQAYGAKQKNVNPKLIKTLRVDIEKRLGKRDQWQLPELRTLFDALISVKSGRKRSAAHERIWFNLTGFCVRPGLGYPGDEQRIENLWKCYQEGVQFDQETQNWIDWWNLWRRCAAGLDESCQQRLFKDIQKFIDPAALKSRKLQAEAKQKSYEDMVKLLSALETLTLEDKERCGNWLLTRLSKSSETQTSWWTLGRLGSRVPFHGSEHHVLSKSVVQNWLPTLLKQDWKKQQHIAFAAVLLSRMSGDRTRDIDEEWKDKIIKKLLNDKQPESWVGMVQQIKELDEKETKRIYGEGLPSGLVLIN